MGGRTATDGGRTAALRPIAPRPCASAARNLGRGGNISLNRSWRLPLARDNFADIRAGAWAGGRLTRRSARFAHRGRRSMAQPSTTAIRVAPPLARSTGRLGCTVSATNRQLRQTRSDHAPSQKDANEKPVSSCQQFRFRLSIN